MLIEGVRTRVAGVFFPFVGPGESFEVFRYLVWELSLDPSGTETGAVFGGWCCFDLVFDEGVERRIRLVRDAALVPFRGSVVEMEGMSAGVACGCARDRAGS